MADNSQNLRVLLIDDDDAFVEHFWVYAELAGWVHDDSDGKSLDNLPDKLDKIEPTLILLDESLEHPVEEYLTVLKTKGYISYTWLISGKDLEENDYIKRGYNIAGIQHKPISLGELPNYPATTQKNSNVPYLTTEQAGELASQLDVAVSVHYITSESLQYTPPIWKNKSYENDPIEEEHEQLFLLLLDRLRTENRSFVRHVDSHKNGEILYYSRLYKLKTENHYWFVREELKKDDTFHSFHNPDKTLNVFLKKIPLLFKPYGITRLRFYKAYKFYDDTRKNEKDNYLFIPSWQHGDGIKKNWIDHTFTSQDHTDIKSIFTKNKPWVISTKKDPDACQFVEWGEKQVDRVAIPIKIRKEDDNKSDEPVGLLAFDRRYDHLPDDKLNESSWWRIVNDKAGNRNPAEIFENELGNMKGLIDQVIDEARDHLEKSKANQIKLWHEVISNTIRKVLPKIKSKAIFYKSTTIKQFLDTLIIWWEYIDGSPSDDDLPSKPINKEITKNNKEILNWYFLKEEKGDIVQGIGGYGKIANMRENELSEAVQPFKEALKCSKKDKDNYAIQDFAEWIKPHLASEYNKKQEHEHFGYLKELKKIKSWIGIPIKVTDQKYLMVVHATKKNYFTTRRVKLLRIVALRMSPFLLWDDVAKSRANLFRSVNHELNSPLGSLIQSAESTENQINKEDLIKNLRFLESTINNMMYLYKPEIKMEGQHTCLKEIWHIVDIAHKAQPLPQRNIQKDCQHESLLLAASNDVLKQVFFNLLSNAFKFSDARKKNATAPILIITERKNKCLLCKISNPIGENNVMTDEQRKWIFTLNYRAPESGNASGSGLGLYIVDVLCEQFGMTHTAEKAEYMNDILYQTFTLSIPLFKEKQYDNQAVILD